MKPEHIIDRATQLKQMHDDALPDRARFRAILNGGEDGIRELLGPNMIIKDIWASIYRAKIIIADCTGKNPNVFYEIGVAHAIGKSVILITQNESDIPFDLRHLRYLIYGFQKKQMSYFIDLLGQTIEAELQVFNH